MIDELVGIDDFHSQYIGYRNIGYFAYRCTSINYCDIKYEHTNFRFVFMTLMNF